MPPSLHLVLVLVLSMCVAEAYGCGSASSMTEDTRATTSIRITALSRGRGVPEPTRAALQKIRAAATRDERRGSVVAITESVIGIEGETRLCVKFASEQAARAALQEFETIAGEVELLAIEQIPCDGP